MAQPIVHNFQRVGMADLKPREPGTLFRKGGMSGTGKENMKKKPMSRRLNRECPCEARGLLAPGLISFANVD